MVDKIDRHVTPRALGEIHAGQEAHRAAYAMRSHLETHTVMEWLTALAGAGVSS